MKTLVAKLVQDALAAIPELQDAVADLDLETTVEAGTILQGFTFHEGDTGDWYILSTPDAFLRFGDAAPIGKHLQR